MTTTLFAVLALMFVVAMPTWRHSRNWGYYPAEALAWYCWSSSS